MGCTGHFGEDDQICYCSECTITRLTAENAALRDLLRRCEGPVLGTMKIGLLRDLRAAIDAGKGK